MSTKASVSARTKSPTIEQTIAELAAELVIENALLQKLGIIVRDLDPIDSSIFVEHCFKLARSNKLSIHLAVPDPDLAVGVQKIMPSLKDSVKERIATDEETAIGWRNEQLRTVAVLSNKPLQKGSSLDVYEIVDDQNAIRLLAQRNMEKANAHFLKNFWQALIHSAAPRDFRLRDVVRFSQELERESTDDKKCFRIKTSLPLLGLMPDAKIADRNTVLEIAKRLTANYKLVEDSSSAEKTDNERITKYLKKLSGKEKTAANQTRTLLRQLTTATDNDFRGVLGKLEFSEAQSVWLARSVPDDGNSGKNKPQIKPLTSTTAGAILSGNSQGLDDLYQSVTQLISRIQDEDLDATKHDLSAECDGIKSTLEIDRHILQLVTTATTVESWGISVEVNDLSDSTILNFDEWGTRSHMDIEGENQPGSLIRIFVDNDALPPQCLKSFEIFKAKRNELVDHLEALTAAPLTVLAAYPPLRKAAREYLDEYGKLLEIVAANAGDARAASGAAAQALFTGLLSIEAYVFKSENEIAAVLSPLHPLHLWRWSIAVEQMLERVEEFSSINIESLEEVLESAQHYLTSLHLPREITGFHSVDLGLAGSLGPLPIYRKEPRSLAVSDGIRELAKVVRSIARTKPYSTLGMRVLLVNPPSPARFLTTLIELCDPEFGLDADLLPSIHIRLRYTDPESLHWINELDQLDEETRDILGLGQKLHRITFSVSDQSLTADSLEQELSQNPAHLTVVFDPFEVTCTPFPRQGSYSLNPWVISYRYDYDRILKKVTQTPVADSSIFSSYLQLASAVEPNLKNSIIGHAAVIEASQQHLARLGENSLWLLIADRHHVPITPDKFPHLSRVSVRVENTRTLTLLAKDLSPFERMIGSELRKSHFDVPKTTLEKIVQDLVSLEPAGILTIGLTTSAKDYSAKAALGKLVVVRDYRRKNPAGLAVSLDSSEARQWLVAGKTSKKQADLLGLRESEDGTIVLDVLEVKTHDDALPVTIKGGVISGDPVDQVMATYRAIASIFAQSDESSVLVKPRREVLRNHLYQACLKDADHEFKKQWHSQLNDFFDGKLKLRIQAQIVRVNLTSMSPTSEKVYLSTEGIPIVVKQLNAEDVGLTLRYIPHGVPEEAVADTLDDLPPSAPGAHETGLDPSEAYKLLTDNPFNPTTEEKDDDDDDGGGASVAAKPIKPEGPGSSHAVTSKAEKPHQDESDSDTLSIIIGKAKRDSSIVSWDVGQQPNGFLMILGASGSGKTETLKAITKQIHDYGVPCLIFDFHGDIVIPGPTDCLLSHGSGSDFGINPMELDSTDPADGGVYAQISILLGMLKSCIPSLGHRQWRVIKDVMNETYAQAGFTDADDSTWHKKPPTFKTVLQLLERKRNDEEITTSQKNIIDSAHDAVANVFEHPIFARTTQLSIEDLLDRSHRLNLKHLDEKIQFVVADTLLRKLARALRSKGNIPVYPKSDRERFRLFVVIDEAKRVTMGGKGRDSSQEIMNTLATEYRKFGLGMILASQMSDHFGYETKGQIATRLVLLPFDLNQAKKNSMDINVDPENLLKLEGKGDGYFRMGVRSVPIRLQVKPMQSKPEN